MVCSVIPDLDVIGFQWGIRYPHMLAHRGLTHSIFFAAVLSAVLTLTDFRHSPGIPWSVFLFLFCSTLSHAFLDMLTNGGRGVGLFVPFSPARYFFPWRPIEVSPIGVREFLSARGVVILLSELKWVWLPSAVVFLTGCLVRRWR
jgi:inner membrane protein